MALSASNAALEFFARSLFHSSVYSFQYTPRSIYSPQIGRHTTTAPCILRNARYDRCGIAARSLRRFASGASVVFSSATIYCRCAIRAKSYSRSGAGTRVYSSLMFSRGMALLFCEKAFLGRSRGLIESRIYIGLQPEKLYKCVV